MPKRDLNSFFKLRIAAGYYIGRRDLDIEIRGNSDIFYSPGRPAGIIRRTIRKANLAPVNERRSKVVRTDASSESAFADDRTDFGKLEHKR